MSVMDDKQRASAYWDRIVPSPQRSRWWNWPRIIEFQNERICGKLVQGWGAGLVTELRKRSHGLAFSRGISVACGNGSKEMVLLRAGVVQHFDLFEISEARIAQGRDLYAAAGLSERVTWHVDDGVEILSRGPGYDLVFWDNALHHMPNTSRAVAASLAGLKPGGAFVMNDFVGANRFQWNDREMRFASAVRRGMPARLMRHLRNPDAMIPSTVRRPDRAKMIEIDPSEAGDSENILPAIRKILPNPTVWLLGGAIYHLALNDVLGNMDPEVDKALLESLLVLETAMIEMGESQYAACISLKQK